MKIPIVIDKKKKLQIVNNYSYNNSDNSNGKSKPGSPQFIGFLLLRSKFSHFNRFITTVLMKVPIVIDEKKNLRKVNNYNYNNSNNSNGKSKLRSLKFISFSLLMN